MIFMFMNHAQDYHHPFTIITLRPIFLASLWEVGGSLLFGLVCSPRPLSLALETFPEEQDFLWRYWCTLICQTCYDTNRCPVFGQQPWLWLIWPSWWHGGIFHFLLLFLLSQSSPSYDDHWWSLVAKYILAYVSLSLVRARLCITVPYSTKHVQTWSVRIVRIVYQG